MSGLVEFLTARLAEDQTTAELAATFRYPVDAYALTALFGGGSSVYVSRWWPWDPARVLAEVAAKRALLLRAENAIRASEAERNESSDPDVQMIHGRALAYEEMIDVMVQCWSDHPEFLDEWRVSP